MHTLILKKGCPFLKKQTLTIVFEPILWSYQQMWLDNFWINLAPPATPAIFVH